MADRISTLPEAVLCHILSFLPTKQVVATSLLSKRWKPLWLSVPTLDFDDKTYPKNKLSYYRFVQSVYAVILSRHLHQPIQTFRLWCQSSLCESTNINIWVNAALQRRVEHLDLRLPLTLFRYEPYINLPSAILSHKTLVVLKLRGLVLKTLSSIDLPSLKILHLNSIRFLEPRYLAELLSGCPVLEDLEANALYFENSLPKGEFKKLPNLLRAYIFTRHIPLDVVSNVEFLRIIKVEDEFGDEEMDTVNEEDAKHCVKNFTPVFHNLIHIELIYFDYIKDWLHVIEVLKHSPKLQNLIINQDYRDFFEEDEEGDWACPQSVPKSVSLQLKTCRVNNYKGSKGEFGFASYIMRNARMLQNMTICSHAAANRQRKLKMIKKLSLCRRRSAKCKLSFK